MHPLTVAARRTLIVVAACLTFSACDEKLSDIAGPSPNLQPTFSSIRDEILSSSDASGRAACVSCHQTGGPAAFILNMRSDNLYNLLVNAPSRQKAGAVLVVPGDPDNSYLVQKLEGRTGIVGQRMPRNNGPFLTDGQMLVIRRWIQTGAPNN